MTRGRAPGPGSLRKRGGRWILDFTDAAGRRKRRVLGTDKRVAERRRLELIRQRDAELDGLGARMGQELPLAEVVESYLADLKIRSTRMHYRNVELKLERLMGVLDGLRVRDLKPIHIIRFRNQLQSEGLAHRTCNLFGDNLRAALNWALDAGMIAENPIARLRRLPEGGDHQRCRRRALSDEEITSLLRAAEEDDERNELEASLAGCVRVPQVPLWETLLATGIRYGEARQLRWGDVDLQRKLLVVRAESAKSRKQRVIPLRDDLVETLKQLRVVHEDVYGRLPTVNCHVFLSPEGVPWPVPSTNPGRILYRVFERAGIARMDLQGFKLDLHALRTTCASRMARSGVPLVMAQRILGHSSIELTAKAYTRLDVEDLRAAVNGLPAISSGQQASAAEKEQA